MNKIFALKNLRRKTLYKIWVEERDSEGAEKECENIFGDN